MSTQISSKASKRPRVILFLFFLILMGPVILAYLLVQKGGAHQFRLTNHGDLITPPVSINATKILDLATKAPLTETSLQGKWWLVYVGPSKCQQSCHDIIYNLRQIRTALGKDASRVERLFIAHPACEKSVCETYLRESYPDMLRTSLESNDFAHLFDPISHAATREIVGEIFILDPRGNIMMHYAADALPKDILSDVKRLLKVSKIG